MFSQVSGVAHGPLVLHVKTYDKTVNLVLDYRTLLMQEYVFPFCKKSKEKRKHILHVVHLIFSFCFSIMDVTLICMINITIVTFDELVLILKIT